MSFLDEDKNEALSSTDRNGGLFLTNRQMGWVLSFFVLVSFFVFISGYFFGKKKATEKFYNKVNQESFADNIYYSVCSMYDNQNSCVKQESTEYGADDLGSEKKAVVAEGAGSKIEGLSPSVSHSEKNFKKTNLEQEKIVADKKEVTHESFYAELIGYGTLRWANWFASRNEKRGFSLDVKRRKSTSAKGKTVVWYQVVTEKFDNKADLIAYVDLIKEKEKLNDVRIVQC